jgi:hypothetical protein
VAIDIWSGDPEPLIVYAVAVGLIWGFYLLANGCLWLIFVAGARSVSFLKRQLP